MSKRLTLIIMAGAFLCLPLASAWAGILQMPTDVAYYDPTKAYNGVTIFAQFNSNFTYMIDMDGRLVHSWVSVGGGNYQSRLEDNGNLSFIGTPSPTPSGATTVLSGGGANCGYVEEQTWNGAVPLKFITWDSSARNHHDYIKIWNKKLQAYTYLCEMFIIHSPAEATNIGAKSPPASTWYDDGVYEYLPTSSTSAVVVWKWDFIDHTCQSYDSSKSNYQSNVFNTPQKFDTNTVVSSRSGPVSDWQHVNSIGFNQELGYILCNSREFNEFYIIDHDGTFVDTTGNGTGLDWSLNFNAAAGTGGDFVYRFGSQCNYNAPSFTIGSVSYSSSPGLNSNGSVQIWGSHCGHYIKPYAYGNDPMTNHGPALPGAGNMLVWDNHGTNGDPLSGNFSQMVEVNPYVSGWSNGSYVTSSSYVWPYNVPYFNATTIATGALGTGYLHQSRQVVWRYRPKSPLNYSSHISGVERLPNGNTLCDSAENNHFLEVTRGLTDASEAADGTSPLVAWEYNFPLNGAGAGLSMQPYYQNELGGAGGNTFRCHRYDVNHPALVNNVQMNADYSVTLKGSTVKGNTLSGRVPCRSIPCEYQ